MPKKDPFGFDEAIQQLESDEGKQNLKESLRQFREEAERREQNRVVTDEQLRKPFNL